MNKDLNNCCKNCLKINIPDCYYLPNQKLCACCKIISEGGIRSCTKCKQQIPVELFERPYLYYCKRCANQRILKPMICECGMTISLSSRYKHIHSPKHFKTLAARSNSPSE